MRFEKYMITETESVDRASFLETGAMVGVNASDKFIDLCRELISYDETRKDKKGDASALLNDFLNELPNQLKGGLDWNPAGLRQLKAMKITDVSNILTTSHVAVGMNNFIKSVIGKGTYFIHGSIEKYYAAEKLSMGSTAGSKANTTDCVICTAPADVVIAALSTTKPDVNEKDGYFTMGNIKCYQVSLKKSKTEAQLGKVAGFMRNDLHVGLTGQEAAKTLANVHEGIWDSIVSASTKIWNKFTEMIDKVLNGLSSVFYSMFGQGITREHLTDIASAIGYKGPLSESTVEYFRTGVLNEGKLTPGQLETINTFTEAIKAKADVILDLINKSLIKAKKLSETKEATVTLIQPLTSIGRPLTNTDAHDIVANYSIAVTVVDFLTKITDVGKTVKRITTEMFFGDTKLPLWKVYGAYKKEKCWTYLGMSGANASKPQLSMVEVFGFKAIPSVSKNKYDMMMTMLNRVDADGKTYILFRSDNNNGTHQFSSNIEGNKEVTVDMDTTMTDVLKKHKL